VQVHVMPSVEVKTRAAFGSLQIDPVLTATRHDDELCTECVSSNRWNPTSPKAHRVKAPTARDATRCLRRSGMVQYATSP
jgi:hypothetical protein